MEDPGLGYRVIDNDPTKPAYLDAGVTNWNADVDSNDGTITLRS